MHGLIDLEYPYGCHWSNEIQKIRTSFSENHAPAFAAPIYHPAVLLTSQSLSWIIDVPLGPYARFQGATVPMWMSMVR